MPKTATTGPRPARAARAKSDNAGKNNKAGKNAKKGKGGNKGKKGSNNGADLVEADSEAAAAGRDRRDRQKAQATNIAAKQTLADKIAQRNQSPEAKAIHAKIDALNATQIALDKRENEVIANGNLSAFSRLQKREDKLEKRERNLNDKLNDVLGRLREPDYGSQKRGPTNFSGQIDFDDLTKKERSLAERLIDRIVALNAKEVPIDERENRAIALGKTVNWFGKLERKEESPRAPGAPARQPPRRSRR